MPWIKCFTTYFITEIFCLRTYLKPLRDYFRMQPSHKWRIIGQLIALLLKLLDLCDWLPQKSLQLLQLTTYKLHPLLLFIFITRPKPDGMYTCMGSNVVTCKYYGSIHVMMRPKTEVYTSLINMQRTLLTYKMRDIFVKPSDCKTMNIFQLRWTGCL